MNTDFAKILSNVTATLKNKGFDKEVAILAEVESATRPWIPSDYQRDYWGHPANRGQPLTPVEQGVVELNPSKADPSIPYAEEGELHKELVGPGKEEQRQYRFKPPQSIKELVDAVKKGHLAVEYFNDQVRMAPSKDVKEFFQILLDKAVEKRKQYAQPRLASLGKLLVEKGYETLGNRLSKIAGDLSKQVTHMVEKHEMPSLEMLYEGSESAQDFEKNIQKMASIYENLEKLVKEFDRKYLEEILHPLDRGDIKEEAATKATISMVRDADEAIDHKLASISKPLNRGVPYEYAPRLGR